MVEVVSVLSLFVTKIHDLTYMQRSRKVFKHIMIGNMPLLGCTGFRLSMRFSIALVNNCNTTIFTHK
jgi:hypothetical protein